MRDLLEKQLATRALTHPGELLHAAGTAIRLEGYGDDILGGIRPKAFVKAYLADLESRDALQVAPQLFGILGGAHGGLVYNEHDTPLFGQIHKMVRDAATRALSRRVAREAVDLMARLRADPDDGSPLYEWGLEEGRYAGVEILHHIPIADMADLLLVDWRLNNRLLAALNARYELAAAGPDLKAEKPWARSLRKELATRLGAAPAPLKTFGKRRLAYWFDKIDKWAKPPRAQKAGAGSTPAGKTRKGKGQTVAAPPAPTATPAPLAAVPDTPRDCPPAGP